MGVDGPVKWGFLSTANINDKLLPGAEASPDVDVVAVASRDAGRAEAYARERGIERAYGSYEELLADAEVEVVYISLPNSMHVEWSIRALEAGKHVLCEKPLSRHPEDVERAFDAAEKAGRILMEAFMYRHNPQTKRLVELVEGGAIGRLRLVRAAFSFPLDDASNVRLNAELEGGALMDVGCYCVSGSRLLAGEPEAVYGEQVAATSGVDELFTGTLRLPGRRPGRDRLRARPARARRARGDRGGGVDLPGRPLALPDAGARSAEGGRHRANRARAGGLVPAAAREHERCRSRSRGAAARP